MPIHKIERSGTQRMPNILDQPWAWLHVSKQIVCHMCAKTPDKLCCLTCKPGQCSVLCFDGFSRIDMGIRGV